MRDRDLAPSLREILVVLAHEEVRATQTLRFHGRSQKVLEVRDAFLDRDIEDQE